MLTNPTTVDFSVGKISSVETLKGSAGEDSVTMTATQWAEFTILDLGTGSNLLYIKASGTMDISKSLFPTTISQVGTGSLTGSGGNDTLTLTGAQLDAILIGASSKIDLGAGSDTIGLTSTSDDLNTLGGLDARIKGVEAISAASAIAGLTISLGGQTEAFKITGGSSNDTISGGKGADTIDGGAGDDTIKLANGHFAAGESITGGTGADTILLTNATSIDFATGTLTGLDTLTGSSGDDTVTVTVNQWKGFDAIDLGAGTGVLNVKVSGTKDISTSLFPTTISHVSKGSLIGTSNDERFTLTGAQLDAILVGASAKIDLGAAGNDWILLTSNSADITNLNAQGDDKIAGVESINASQATDSVSINLSNQTENITVVGSKVAADTIIAGHGADWLLGSGGADFLNGRGGADTIYGGNGADTLIGGAGNDWLEADSGQDTVVFNTALNASTNVDFVSLQVWEKDIFQLENSVFTELKTGTLAAGAFYIGATAHDTNDRIIYNQSTGALSYDADGSYSGKAVPFATIPYTMNLTYASFVVV